MVKHHPDSNTLIEFAASSLPAAQSVVVSTHLQACSECRHKLAQLPESTLLPDLRSALSPEVSGFWPYAGTAVVQDVQGGRFIG